MPHDRQEAKIGGSDWLKCPPTYHTRGSLRGGKMRWPRILFFRTTRVFALETHGFRQKEDQGPQPFVVFLEVLLTTGPLLAPSPAWHPMCWFHRPFISWQTFQRSESTNPKFEFKRKPSWWIELLCTSRWSSKWNVAHEVLVIPVACRSCGNTIDGSVTYYPTIFHSLHHQITCRSCGMPLNLQRVAVDIWVSTCRS